MRTTFIISIIFFLFSCKSEEPLQKKIDYYSIQVSFESRAEAENSQSSLFDRISDTLFVKKSKLLIGQFENFRRACDKGFELFADTLIPNFNVVYKDSVLQNDYKSLFFVGKYLDRPGLYKTELLNPDPELVWSKWGRKIMKLYRSNDKDDFFFTASLHEKISGNFPLIMDTRIYHFNRENEEPSLLKRVGHVMNIECNWNTDTTFSALYTILDSMMTSSIIQHQIDFNSRGEVIDSTERIFELIKDGIPIPNFSDLKPVSPDLRYKISTIKTDSTLQLNIIDELNGMNNIVANLIGDIKKNVWGEKGEYLFLSSRVSKDSTDLMIVDLNKMEMTKKFTGKGEKNFIVVGNLLIFDDGLESDSYITMFRYRKNKIYGEIRINGGCGVLSIPTGESIFL